MSGPAPRSLSGDDLSDLLARHAFGTLATTGADGLPHLTTMVYAWDPATRTARFSSTDGRLKVRHLRADPRAALHVGTSDHWAFAVVQGRAEVSGPTVTPGDAVGRELLAMLPPEARPEDPAEWYARQVAERRVVVRLAATRMYGTALDLPGAEHLGAGAPQR